MITVYGEKLKRECHTEVLLSSVQGGGWSEAGRVLMGFSGGEEIEPAEGSFREAASQGSGVFLHKLGPTLSAAAAAAATYYDAYYVDDDHHHDHNRCNKKEEEALRWVKCKTNKRKTGCSQE